MRKKILFFHFYFVSLPVKRIMQKLKELENHLHYLFPYLGKIEINWKVPERYMGQSKKWLQEKIDEHLASSVIIVDARENKEELDIDKLSVTTMTYTLNLLKDDKL